MGKTHLCRRKLKSQPARNLSDNNHMDLGGNRYFPTFAGTSPSCNLKSSVSSVCGRVDACSLFLYSS